MRNIILFMKIALMEMWHTPLIFKSVLFIILK